VPDEANGDSLGSQPQNPLGQASPGVAEIAAALFGDLIANLERLLDSPQKESQAEIAYMDRIVLLAGGGTSPSSATSPTHWRLEAK
jgi:hypothetical protein